ncbi:glycoside hydrolase family 65 protein [Companilactobacillus sp. FL22-1]|uniref:glycoside hydrolase family 65 protein n=1 Tax=Companilactobacillus sp. FL22-1 TaxID=3373892 RepID=UPI003754D1D8
MKFCINTDKKNSWRIATNNHDDETVNKIETLMFQGNGYLGIRAAEEESTLHERRNMFVSGTFDAFPGEVTELPNLPDILNIDLQVDGHPLCLKDGKVEHYQKYLNMKNGELTRIFDWIIDGKRITFRYNRFVSMDDKHLFVSKVEITADQDINLKIKSGIDGQQSNSSTQHLIEGDKRLFDENFIQLQMKTQQSGIDFAFNVRHRLFVDEVMLNTKPSLDMGRRQIFGSFEVNLQKGQKLAFVKYVNVSTSIDRDIYDLVNQSISALRYAGLSSYQELLHKSTRAWDKAVWQKNYLKIEAADEKPQVAVNFARYQLAASTPHDPRMSIGAKGLTGEGYKGHTFWDTEIFMLPYYIFTKPKVAKSLLNYRYLGLEGAHRKARNNNYQGAQFPWEAANPSDGETAPLWGSADIITGKPMKVWSGFIEPHITSDIIFAVMEYLSVTRDQEFAKKMGYEIVLDGAKFWSSRLEYDYEKDRYEINDVIGPDEYKEHINNNAYTNYTAQWSIQKAIKVYNLIKEDYPDLYVELNNRLDLDDTYTQWVEQVNKIYLPQPNEAGVIPEDDQYLSKKVIDVSRFVENNQLSNIFKTYNLTQIGQMQVTKQSDVLLLMCLFEDMFSDDVKRSNWDYYEPKTTHDSSLSLSTHSILASELGLADKAYHYYEMSCETDLGVHVGKAVQGIHLASCGGIWNMTVQGFGGLRTDNGKLQIEPHLPKEWKSLKYQINWQGSEVFVEVDHQTLKVHVHGDPIEFINHGQEYQVSANSGVEIKNLVEVIIT